VSRDLKELPFSGTLKPVEGCAIAAGWEELMCKTIEGPIEEIPHPFEIEIPCTADGCNVIAVLGTVVLGKRKLFYKSRGEDAPQGLCQQLASES
jgi:hypothetical protein